jgi:D-alanyl-D-alanine carboxypeptidase/D-alanyl-D-alanine-endopeptidase (penicillin-binding protein 4)
VRRAVAAALAAFVALGAQPTGASEALTARLDTALARPLRRGAQVGALVVSSRDGRELYARGADRPLAPASNQKILTALAALEAFGPSHRFRTALRGDRPLDANGALGTLYVIGGGDPGLTPEAYWRLAAELRALGLTRVRDLVLDDLAFDRVHWHPTWGAVSSRPYHAPIAALAAAHGVVNVWVGAGASAGAPVSVRLDPPVAFEIVNRATTGARRSRNRLRVERELGPRGERVVVSGSLPAGGKPRPVPRSVLDPVRYAGAVLRLQLEAVGVDVTGEVRVAPAPAGAAFVHDFYGPSVGEVVTPFLKYSLNEVGETLVKDLALQRGAARGTFEAGASAAHAVLAGLGLPLGGVEIVDGSGLSPANRATPRLLVEALVLADHRFGLGPELAAGLPIAGTDGTLRRRARGARGRVRAKTGLLSSVVALSGYAEAPDGDVRIFSVLLNGLRGDVGGGMAALDAFAQALAEVP